jgi:hypothetical protein
MKENPAISVLIPVCEHEASRLKNKSQCFYNYKNMKREVPQT